MEVATGLIQENWGEYEETLNVIICYFSFPWPLISLSWSWEGCWSLSQLHMGKGQINPWMSRQLIVEPYVSNWGSMPYSQGPQHCSEGDLAYKKTFRVLFAPGLEPRSLRFSAQSTTHGNLIIFMHFLFIIYPIKISFCHAHVSN